MAQVGFIMSYVDPIIANPIWEIESARSPRDVVFAGPKHRTPGYRSAAS